MLLPLALASTPNFLVLGVRLHVLRPRRWKKTERAASKANSSLARVECAFVRASGRVCLIISALGFII